MRWKNNINIFNRVMELSTDKTLSWLDLDLGCSEYNGGFNWTNTEEGRDFWVYIFILDDIKLALDSLYRDKKYALLEKYGGIYYSEKRILRKLGYNEKEQEEILKCKLT